MGEFQRWFTPLHGKRQSRWLLGFDVEGYGGPGGFICGSIVGSSLFEFYTSRAELWTALKNYGRHGAWLFAHNLEYDLPIVAGDELWSGDLLFKDDGILWGTYQLGKKKARFYDSTNLFPRMSVADLGEMVGLPKLDSGTDWRVAEQNWLAWGDLSAEQRAQMRRYNLRDAEIVYRAVALLQEELLRLGGSLRPTIASCSLDLYRRVFHKWPWPAVGEETNRLARGAFYGGRTENFAHGTIEHANLYDVNSLYPFVQEHARYPHSGHIQVITPKRLSVDLSQWGGVIAGEITLPDAHVPPLPTHARKRLFFPTGKLSGLWTVSEWRAAIERGARPVKIDFVLGSPVTFNPFNDFVEQLYALKLGYSQAHDGRAQVVKLLLNSLYGRFGLNTDKTLYRWQSIPPNQDWEKLRGVEVTQHAGYLIAIIPTPSRVYPAYANVFIAAEVAAAARLHLLSALEIQGERVAYCDTDSILTTGRMKTGAGLGEWRAQMLDGQADLLGLKEYMLHNQVVGAHYVAKGIPSHVMAEYLTTGQARFQKALKIREAISRGDNPAAWVEVKRERGAIVLRRCPVSLEEPGPGKSVSTRAWVAEELPDLLAGTMRWRLSRGEGRGARRPAKAQLFPRATVPAID